MSMMCPPQSVKIVSTPSFFRAFATRCPPETTLASRLFCWRVSSAVVLRWVGVSTVAILHPRCQVRRVRLTPVLSGRLCRGIRRTGRSEVPLPQGSQHDQRQDRGNHVEGHGDGEYAVPPLVLGDRRRD